MAFVPQDHFSSLHACGHNMLIHYVKWNTITKNYETNFSLTAKLRASFICIVGLTYAIIVLQTTYNKDEWNKYDILTLMCLPVFFVATPLMSLYPYFYQKEIINILDNINAIDTLLRNYGAPNLFHYRGAIVLSLLVYTYILVILFVFYWWHTFFTNPNVRQILLMGCISPVPVYHTLCTIAYKLYIIRKINQLWHLINNTVRKGIYSDKCSVCTKDAIKGDVCYEHVLHCSSIISWWCIKTTKIIYKLDRIIINSSLTCGFGIAPLYFVYLLRLTFNGPRGEYEKCINVCLLTAWGTLYTFAVAILNTYLNNKITKMARMASTLYNTFLYKTNIRTETICLSINVLQERPQFYLYGCIRLNPEQILALFHGFIMFSIMILQFHL